MTYINVTTLLYVLIVCSNAETILSQTHDLHILYNILSPLSTKESYTWAIPMDNICLTLNWSGRWGPQEDSILLVGFIVSKTGRSSPRTKCWRNRLCTTTDIIPWHHFLTTSSFPHHFLSLLSVPCLSQIYLGSRHS